MDGWELKINHIPVCCHCILLGPLLSRDPLCIWNHFLYCGEWHLWYRSE